jgi:phage baseplate assembly protein W
MEYTVTPDGRPIVIGADGVAGILQSLRTILATLQDSVFLNRDFARLGSALDKPEPKAIAMEVAEIYRAVKKYEPRVEITDIRFVQNRAESMDGVLAPQVRVKIRQGVL